MRRILNQDHQIQFQDLLWVEKGNLTLIQGSKQTSTYFKNFISDILNEVTGEMKLITVIMTHTMWRRPTTTVNQNSVNVIRRLEKNMAKLDAIIF